MEVPVEGVSKSHSAVELHETSNGAFGASDSNANLKALALGSGALSSDDDDDDFSQRMTRKAATRQLTIRVIVEDKDFNVRVGGGKKIEELCHEIESAFVVRYPGEKPLNCCLLLDEDAVPLEFSDTVAESLVEGALVYAVTADIGEMDFFFFFFF